jgi:lysine biosynthesis protein LysW
MPGETEMTTPPQPVIARCPECDSRLYFDRPPDLGQILACPECETSLEVIGTNPIRLDWAYDEGEGFFGAGTSREEVFDDYEQNDSGYSEDEDDDWS